MTTSTTTGSLPGPHKAAILLLGLDEQVATEILRHLPPAQLRQLLPLVDELALDAGAQLDQVFGEFADLMARPSLPPSGSDYMRRLAAAAIGEAEVQRLLQPAEAAPDPREALRSARTQTLAEMLADEHPQVAAVILTQLSRDQAAKVLLALPAAVQSDLIGRIGELEELPAGALETASEVLARALAESGVQPAASSEFDGTAFAAGLLNEITPADSDRLLEALTTERAQLVPKLREAMFTFEDLGRLDKRQVGLLMREVPGDALRQALRQASESLRELFLGSVSQRVAAEIRDDLANMPPVRLSEIEKAQRTVVDTALQMAAEGRLQLPSNGAAEALL